MLHDLGLIGPLGFLDGALGDLKFNPGLAPEGGDGTALNAD
jgi:hypothetical protein